MDYERYRNRSTPNVPGFREETLNGVHTKNAESLPSLDSEQTYDFKVLNFHKRQAAGEIFNNSYLHIKTHVETTDVLHNTFRNYNSSGVLVYSDDIVIDRSYLASNNAGLTNAPIVSLNVAEAERNAQISALANVNSTDVDALAFAGEWSKTKNLHRDLGNALLELFNGGVKARTSKSSFEKIPMYDERGRPILNRKGQPVFRYLHKPARATAKGSNPSQRMANAYLVGRYGVLPLLSDLESAGKLLNRRFSPRFTARGTATVQGQASSVKTVADWHGYWTIDVQTTRTYTARYGILYETDAYSRKLAQLGLTRPLSSAWQVMPWSFVGDWFFEFGKYLDAIQPAGLTKTLAAWGGGLDTVVNTWTVRGITHTSTWPSNEVWTGSWNGAAIKTTITKRRDPWVAQVPSHPSLGTGFTQLRSADFAALMLQRIRSKF